MRTNLRDKLAEGLLVVGEDRLEEEKREDKLVPLVNYLAVEAPPDHQLEDKQVTWAKEILKKPKK